ncbi:MAG: pyruvate kinase [Phycisphaerae bacterium]|nr:pyruvate kinase [Phycisphaerae bacterium]
MIRTKIIATVGPASADPAVLRRLIDAGVDVFRLNFSHGSRDAHARAVRLIHEAGVDCGRHIAIMGDLCGPKIRLNAVAGGRARLNDGAVVRIVRGNADATADCLTSNYDALIDEMLPGQRLLIDDGSVRLRVVEKNDAALVCAVDVGGHIADRKGINLPDTQIRRPALTDKDRDDLAWAIEQRLDYVALSFVRRGEDVAEVRRIIAAAGGDVHVVAKIEKPQAIDSLDAIIEESDVVLVARGDLGVEMEVERVPILQKTIARQCRYGAKPIIVATQMLQSMVHSPVPTRAEVSDVANAILDHADVLMLSAETAVGEYPVEAVRILRRVAEQTERHLERIAPHLEKDVLAAALRLSSAVARGASLVARDLDAQLVAVWSDTGSTVRLLSKHRMGQTIVGLCPTEHVARRMAMYFGVVPLLLNRPEATDEMFRRLDAELIARRLAEPGDLTVVVAGTKLNRPGSTNMLLIHLVGESDSAASQTP